MKYPICKLDLKSDILCPKCEEKLRKGLVSEIDIKICKLLYELEEEGKYPILKRDDIEYVKAAISSGMIIIVLKGHRGGLNTLTREWRRIAESLKELMLKKGILLDRKTTVRFIVDRSNIRSNIEQVLHPIRLLEFKESWLLDGTEVIYLKVSAKDVRRSKMDVKILEEALKKLIGVEVKINVI